MITMASSTFFLLFALVAVTFGRVAADCDEACQRDCSMKLHECGQPGSHSQGGGHGGMGYAAADDDDDDDELDDDEQNDDSSQDPCSSSPQDPCSQAKGVSVCLDKLSHCEDFPAFKQTADGLRAMETQYCSTEIRCAALSKKCSCLVKSGGVEKICTAYEDVDQCLDSLPEECFSVGSGSILQLTRNTMDAYNEIVCDREAGGCPEAAECMSMLSKSPSSSPKAGGSGNIFGPPAVPTLDANNVCTTLSVFDCLTKASDTCSIDQGSVTMTQIKIETNEFCTGTLSKSLPVLEKCGAFTQCLITFEYMPDFLKSAPKIGFPDAKMLKAIVTLSAQTSRSGFWCSWIRQHYKCAILNKDSCELPEDAVTAATRKNETLSTMCIGAATYVAGQYAGDAVTVQKSAPLFALVAATWFSRLY